jgi:hypothetical protein
MAIDKIKEMVDGYSDKIDGIADQISAVQSQIDEFQEQQDALQETLEQIYSEVVAGFLVGQCDFFYRGTDFYGGSGIGTINSNIENWQAYNEVTDPITGDNYYDVSVNPPEEKPYDESFDAYELIIVDDSTVSDKYDEFAHVIDYIHHPMGLSGMYGTKANIDNLTGAKGALEANKQKFIDSESKLARFGEN